MLRNGAHTRKFGAARSVLLLAAGIALLASRAAFGQAAPEFSSTPVTAAVAGEAYSYSITVTDADASDTIAITAAPPPLPPWLTLTDNGNRTATLAGVPGGGDVGNHPITLSASDGVNAVQQAFTITVAAEEVPIATDDAYSTPQDVRLDVNRNQGVLANDDAPGGGSGPGGGPGPGDDLSAVLATGVAHGTLALQPDGAFTYTPAVGYSGPDSFTYRATNGAATSDPATVTITVTDTNAAPVAANDGYSTAASTQLTVAQASGVLGNDTDADGDALTAQLVGDVAHGTLALSANGSFVYAPTAGFVGLDTFTYRANDGTTTSGLATVTISVTAVNQPPIAAADAYTTTEDAPLTVAPAQGVLANDTDPDAGTTLTAVLAGAVSSGTLAFSANGSFTYTPAPNFNGTATFSYTARDGTLASAPAIVTIGVTAVNDAPFFTNAPVASATEGLTYTYTMTATDPDGGPLVFAAPTLPAWLAFVPPATISGTPGPTNVGVHGVVVTVSDGVAAPVSLPFQITVQGVDDAPVIAAIPDQTATEGVPFSLNLAAFVTDADTPPGSIAFAAVGALPAGLSLTSAGLLSGPPQFPPGGAPLTVAFTATDAATAVRGQFRLSVLRAGRADLAVVLSAAPNPVAVGAPATWTLTVTNQAAQVDVPSFVLDAQFGGDVPFRFDAPSTGACTTSVSGNDTRLTCTLGPLAGGASTAVTIAGAGSLAGDVFATANVSVNCATPIDETPGNDRATASLSVAQQIVAAPAQSILGLAARAVAAADLDGDGFADLAVATGSQQGLIVLTNVVDTANGGKRVLSTTPLALGGEPGGNDVEIADLDGDHKVDIVVAGGAGAPNRVFLAGAAGFASAQLANAAGGSRAVAIGDVNGDGFPDLVFASAGGSAVFLNSGSGGRFTAGPLVGGQAGQDVILRDLFGDALPELVIANANGDAQVFRNTGGAFTLELTLATGPTTSVGAADFNNDGKMDLVFGRSGGATPGAPPSNLVWLNTSGASGGFFLADELGAATTFGVTVADFDADGDADVVAVNGDGVAVYANSGATGRFALRPQQLDTTGATMAVTGKLNADDRVDLAVVANGGIDVFYNDGAGNFGSGDTAGPTIALRGEATVVVKVGGAYTDAGATATDAVDGDVTSRIKVTNPVDTAVIGTYTVTYNATDLSGNAAVPATRTVSVQAEQTAEGGGGGALGLELVLLLLAKIGTCYFSRERSPEK